MAAGTVLSVTKLNEYVSGILSGDPRLRSVRVSGEISGFKRHSSGHLYFNLKDSGAVVPCVMFRSDASKLRLEPEDGMKVVARGSVSLYVRDGRYQLYVSGLAEAGDGELYAAFLKLKEKLQAEGVFDNCRTLPQMPRCIGIATSETGAALHDMLNIIRRRFPTMNVLFAPCKVQGEEAPREIAAAVKALQRFEYCDVIIVGRGGGSYEDLYCFNSELVARTIALSRIPVVSAVGHETDFTISDFAADLRAPTPSAAAELCCPLLSDAEYGLSQCIDELEGSLASRLSEARRAVEIAVGSAAMLNPQHAIELKRQMLSLKLTAVGHSTEIALNERKHKLDEAMAALRTASPQYMTRLGYALVTDSAGKPVRSVGELARGDEVRIRLSDGSAKAEIKETEIL